MANFSRKSSQVFNVHRINSITSSLPLTLLQVLSIVLLTGLTGVHATEKLAYQPRGFRDTVRDALLFYAEGEKSWSS